MKVLFIQRNARIGGGNTYLCTVAPELRRRGHQLRLMIGPGPCRRPLHDLFQAPLIWNPSVDWLASRVVGRAIRTWGAEIVNAHTFKTGSIALPACRKAGVPLVQHVHSLIPRDEAAQVLQAASRVIVMNESVRDWVAQVQGVAAKTVLSVLPVDPQRFYPRPPGEHEGFRIVYCGRLARRKAAFAIAILDILDDLADAVPGVEMAIVGGRSHWRQVAKAAAEANARLGRLAVTVLGELPDPSEIIAGADLVIGTGYVCLEALASDRHTIGVGIQGLTGLVTPKTFSASVAANFGDHAAPDPDVTPEKLKQEILQGYRLWLDSPAATWGHQAIQSQFSPGRVADDLERVFAEA